MDRKVKLVQEGKLMMAQRPRGGQSQRDRIPGMTAKCQLCSTLGGRVRMEMASNLIGTKEASNSAKCWALHVLI